MKGGLVMFVGWEESVKEDCFEWVIRGGRGQKCVKEM